MNFGIKYLAEEDIPVFSTDRVSMYRVIRGRANRTIRKGEPFTGTAPSKTGVIFLNVNEYVMSTNARQVQNAQPAPVPAPTPAAADQPQEAPVTRAEFEALKTEVANLWEAFNAL